MRIVSWNCNGKFREKFQFIKSQKADIYVIQECEDPSQINHKAYQKFASNALWCGKSKNKGLGIFAGEHISLKNNHWPNHYLREFISAEINEQFNLLGVWTRRPYIEEYCVYQSIHFDKYDEKLVAIGDFNSNQIWDKKHGERTHTAVVEKLEEKHLVSAYHHLTGENHGSEKLDTFYLYRHLDKGYHLDYAFLDPARLKQFKILEKNKWLKYSDHLPLVLDID